MEERGKMVKFYSCLAECYKREVKIVNVQEDDICASRCWEKHEDQQQLNYEKSQGEEK